METTTEVRGIDWRKKEHQRPIHAALREARRKLHELRDWDKLDEQAEKVLAGLVCTTQFAYSNLVSSSRNEAVAFMAWCARSLLETEIWMEYVTVSRANLERFLGDWVNDAEELLRCVFPSTILPGPDSCRTSDCYSGMPSLTRH